MLDCLVQCQTRWLSLASLPEAVLIVPAASSFRAVFHTQHHLSRSITRAVQSSDACVSARREPLHCLASQGHISRTAYAAVDKHGRPDCWSRDGRVWAPSSKRIGADAKKARCSPPLPPRDCSSHPHPLTQPMHPPTHTQRHPAAFLALPAAGAALEGLTAA